MKPKEDEVTKIEDLQLRKIRFFIKIQTLKTVIRILTMEHSGFRTYKSVKNINRLFVNLDPEIYSKKPELWAHVWIISHFSKEWLDGIIDTELILTKLRGEEEYKKNTDLYDGIINDCLNDTNIVSEPVAKAIFDLISEALQYGYVTSAKHEYDKLLSQIDIDSSPGGFKKLADRLFEISHSLLDIKHNTNFVSNKVTFNTDDLDSVKNAIEQTQDSLSTSNGVFQTGIKRWNSLLSPGYMNGRIYVYLGLPGSYKSGLLLKSALDIRKYNPGFKSKTPGMKPCVLYVTMENSFTETIERIWSMCFDDSIINYELSQAVKLITNELGIGKIIKNKDEESDIRYQKLEDSDLSSLIKEETPKDPTIEVVVKYFSYREINTDDLFTVIQDLRDENLEVCALSFDYIKRIRPNVPMIDNERMELDKIMNELKALAVLLDIPVITAHQMNRAAAATVDAAVRRGEGDATRLVGREHVGSSWAVIEVADWACVLNIETKNNTDDRYLIMNVVKRRRIDTSAGELSKYTYLAHPFQKNNGLKLIDDIHLGKILSLQSLVNDIDDIVSSEKANTVPRNKLEHQEFVDFDDGFE